MRPGDSGITEQYSRNSPAIAKIATEDMRVRNFGFSARHKAIAQ
ncbi:MULTISPECIES: hypothetical protein [unclassified Calothrix]|nr:MULTISPECIES: hypothetical protein [unclassified Calothrix]